MEQYWEWLCSIPCLYPRQREILLRCFHTPEGVWRASSRELEYLIEKGFRWAERVLRCQRELPPEKTVNMRLEKGIQFISCEHTSYPERLRMLPDRPHGLFYRGALPADGQPSVAVVGARLCTRGGRELAQDLAASLARAGAQIVSGAACGIDGAAQWAALEAGGPSFAVLGCGADVCYPASHARLLERAAAEGGVLSELPPGAPPVRHHFPMRNRIISGLADVVVVVEARRKSGSLITAGCAAEQGRTVLAVPGRPGDVLSVGCNELIDQGAGIFLSAESLIKTLFPNYKPQNRQLSDDILLAPAEELVYSSFGLQAESLDELQARTALSLPELSESLLSLELRGLIQETERGWYRRKPPDGLPAR